MKLVPQNDYVLCKKIPQEQSKTDLILYSKDEFPSYKIIDIGMNIDKIKFNIGDEVVCNSTGTKVQLDDNELYLFKQENIIGKAE